MDSTDNPLRQSEAAHTMSSFDALLDRHRAFWDRLETDRPLLKAMASKGWQPYFPFVLRGGGSLPDNSEITPGMLDPVATSEPYRPSQVIDGDFINGWGPYDSCWSEAILGCRIKRAGPSVWTAPIIRGWDEIDKVPTHDSAAWLGELLAANRALVDEVDGTYPICQPLLRGPLDMAEAAVPTEVLFSSFHEQPGPLRHFLEICTDLFINIAKRRLSETPAFHGGYMVRYEWGLWAPGTTVQFQADAMRNLSSKMYRDFMFEIDRRIACQFEYPIMHTHSGSAHILPVLVEVPELRAIEVSIDPDPYGPPPLTLLPSLQRIQEAGKSLLISGPMSQSDLDSYLSTLSPRGLAIRAALLPPVE